MLENASEGLRKVLRHCLKARATDYDSAIVLSEDLIDFVYHIKQTLDVCVPVIAGRESTITQEMAMAAVEAMTDNLLHKLSLVLSGTSMGDAEKESEEEIKARAEAEGISYEEAAYKIMQEWKATREREPGKKPNAPGTETLQ